MRTSFCKAVRLLTLSLVLLSASACEHTFVDDMFEIHRQIDRLKDSHEDLRQRIDNFNESMTTLQAIVDVLMSGYYISQVERLADGYVISFTNGKVIAITHGNDGKDGASVHVGVTLVDGNYYWTLNGAILRDDAGNMIPVISDTVKTPLFDIFNGYWYVSFDGGSTWRIVGPASGRNGFDGEDGVQNIIRVDESSPDMVIFVLADGTTLAVPYRTEIHLFLESGDARTGISDRETIRVRYELSNVTDDTQINVSTDGYYSAKVVKDSPRTGSIVITCPRTYSDGFVNVLVYEKAGIVDTHIIRFYERQMVFSDGLEFNAPAEGGTVSVPFSVNFPFRVEVEEASASWLELLAAGGSGEGVIKVKASPNDVISRTGILHIVPDNSDRVLATVFITQQSTLCTIDIGSFMIPYEGGTFLSTIRTVYGASVSVPEENGSWLKAGVIPEDNGDFTVALTVEPNPHEASRSSVVDVFSGDGSIRLAELRVIQEGRFLDIEYAMIFVVHPNYSNDFTAYLPIDIYSDYDCYIDWGDGTGQRYSTGYRNADGENSIHHKYEGLAIGRAFEVVITGTVTSLNAGVVPQALRSSVTEVLQWGNTGLINMDYAFNGFSGLTTLHMDESGAFENVRNFNNAFSECPRLTTISEHLFDYAVSAESFDETFRSDISLAMIPDNLFRNAKSAKSFYGTFRDCRRLVTVPENLFGEVRSAYTFSSVFRDCSRLASIPDNLFASCVEVTDFSEAFRNCRSLASIPSGLFANNHKALSFFRTFQECYSIQEIPEGLFDANIDAYNLSRAFSGCGDLKSIPTALFDNLRKIVYFESLFSGCERIKGESPWTLVNGQKVHLYERYSYPDLFAPPYSYGGCFGGCWQMTDYDRIPGEWR